jgi:hypothetical protein
MSKDGKKKVVKKVMAHLKEDTHEYKEGMKDDKKLSKELKKMTKSNKK